MPTQILNSGGPVLVVILLIAGVGGWVATALVLQLVSGLTWLRSIEGSAERNSWSQRRDPPASGTTSYRCLAQLIRSMSVDLDNGLRTLQLCFTVAPLLGLFGTVSGMIQAFDDLALCGEVRTDALAGGVAQALLTTQAGLIVAIPLAIGRFGLRGAAKALRTRMHGTLVDVARDRGPDLTRHIFPNVAKQEVHYGSTPTTQYR